MQAATIDRIYNFNIPLPVSVCGKRLSTEALSVPAISRECVRENSVIVTFQMFQTFKRVASFFIQADVNLRFVQ